MLNVRFQVRKYICIVVKKRVVPPQFGTNHSRFVGGSKSSSSFAYSNSMCRRADSFSFSFPFPSAAGACDCEGPDRSDPDRCLASDRELLSAAGDANR